MFDVSIHYIKPISSVKKQGDEYNTRPEGNGNIPQRKCPHNENTTPDRAHIKVKRHWMSFIFFPSKHAARNDGSDIVADA